MKHTLAERFWAKVDKSAGPDACWEWTAYRDQNGYGRFSLGGKNRLAHRISYVLANGAIPDGVYLDHACRRPSCVNPIHLRAVSQKQNMENRRGANRAGRSGRRGVCWDRCNKRWRARVGHNGRDIHVGLFDDLAAADVAARAKRLELFSHNRMDRQTTRRITDPKTAVA